MELGIAREKFIFYLDFLDKTRRTIKGYQADLILFERYLTKRYNKNIEVEEIEAEDIEDFLLDMKKRGLAPASRNRRLHTLRSFYNFCTKKKIIDSNIAAKVEAIRLPFKEREYLVEEDVLKIMDAIKSPIVSHVVGVLFYAGLRITEALNLKIMDVKMEQCIIRVRSGKGQKDRSVPICPKLHSLLENYCNKVRVNNQSDYFFATRRTGKVSAQYVNYEIHRATKKLGLNCEISAHTFRHSFATALINKDVGVFHVQKLLGHSDLRVTSRYCHANISELRNAVNRL